jgi:cell division septation protein DedD
MAESDHRSYRDFATGRGPERPRAQAADDQLAELARLISQDVPMNRSGRSRDRTSPAAEEQDSSGAQDEVLREPNDDRPLEGSRAWPDVRDSRYQDDEYENEPHDDDHAHDDEYYEEPNTGRRGGFVLVAAIFGLAVLGTAGVFAYRAMFGGPMLPTLPPIIKAEGDPNKIIPSHANSRANNSRQPDAGNGAGSGEPVVSREGRPVEMPVTVNTAPPPPSTVPVFPDPPLPGSPGAVVSFPTASAPATNLASSPQSATTTRLPTSSEGPAAAPRPRTAPVALEGTHVLAPVPPNKPPASETASAAPATSGGGYAVQVSSHRSEQEAQSWFRALQAKYANLLGGRQPIIRRADLGAKGIYYRAMVGPFDSADQATDLCTNLKAAGGSCLVQKN